MLSYLPRMTLVLHEQWRWTAFVTVHYHQRRLQRSSLDLLLKIIKIIIWRRWIIIIKVFCDSPNENLTAGALLSEIFVCNTQFVGGGLKSLVNRSSAICQPTSPPPWSLLHQCPITPSQDKSFPRHQKSEINLYQKPVSILWRHHFDCGTKG